MANNKNRFSCLKEDLQESDNLDKSNSRQNIFTNPSNLPINSRWQRSPDSPKSNTFKKKYGQRRREDDRGTKERGRNNYRNNNYHLGRNKGRNTTNITGNNLGEFNGVWDIGEEYLDLIGDGIFTSLNSEYSSQK